MIIFGYPFEILIIIADALLKPGLDAFLASSAAKGKCLAASLAIDHDLDPVCTHASPSL
jgi:hypothetical protein